MDFSFHDRWNVIMSHDTTIVALVFSDNAIDTNNIFQSKVTKTECRTLKSENTRMYGFIVFERFWHSTRSCFVGLMIADNVRSGI